MFIVLATNQHPMSVAIRETTHSKYSHVAIVDTKHNRILEANPTKGVCYTPINVFKKHYPVHEVRQLDGDIEIARPLTGKPYDYLGVAGQAYNNQEVQDPYKYMCTEVVAVAATGVNSTKGHMLLPDHFLALSWKVESNYQLGES